MTKQFLFSLLVFFFAKIISAQIALRLDWTAAADSACVACGTHFPKVLPNTAQGAYTIATGWSGGGSNLSIAALKYTASGALQWQRRFDTGHVDAMEDGLTDTTGNLYVAGTSRSTFSNSNWEVNVLQKFDPDGQLLWTYIDPDTFGIYNQVRHLLRDKAENIYMVGERSDYTIADVDEHIQVYKFSPDGELLWNKKIDRSDLSYTYPLHARMIDETIEIISIGITAADTLVYNILFKVSASGEITGVDLLPKKSGAVTRIDASGNLNYAYGFRKYQLIKYSAQGDSLWQYFRAPGGTIDPPIDRLEKMTDDKNGNLYLAGTHNIAGGEMSMLVTKLDAGGNLLWEHHLDSVDTAWGASPEDIVVDNQRVYVVGRLEQNGISAGLLAVYSLDGVLLDTATYIFPGNKYNFLSSVAVTDNRIWVSGTSNNGVPNPAVSYYFITQQYHLDSVSALHPALPPGAMRFFPNPTSGMLQVEMPFPISGPLHLNVSDGLGRCVMDREFGHNDNLTLNLEGLPNGAYYFKVNSLNMTWVGRVMLFQN